MEYIPKTFQEITKLSHIEILSLLIQLLQGIEHLHSNDWCHCDIKPSNIGIRKDGNKVTAVLLDFGLAYKKKPNETFPIKSRRGSEYYRNPDLVISPLSDIYSIGRTIEYIFEKFKLDTLFDEKLKDIVKKATHRNASERYQNATELRNAIQTLLFFEEDNKLRTFSLPKYYDKNYNGYKPEFIISQWYNDSPDYNFDIPDDIKDYYNTIKSYVEQDMKKKGQWNGSIIGMRDCIISRDPINEEPILIVQFAKSNYVHFKTMYAVLQQLPKLNPQLYKSYKDLFGTFDKRIQPFNVTIGVHISVITNDSTPKLFFCERSTHVEKLDKSVISCGITETVQENDIIDGVPDIYETAIRGMKEELNITILPEDKERIKFLGCGSRTSDNIWGFVGVVDLRGYSGEMNYSKERIVNTWENAKDKFEFKKLHCIPLEISSVLSFVNHTKNLDQGAIALAIGILFYCFPEEEVNNALFNTQ